MVNEELVSLCRTVVAAIQDTDSFDARQLRRLILHIVPQLLTELDILGGVLEGIRLPDPPAIPEVVEGRVEKAANAAVRSRHRAKKRPASKKARKK
jgi:hypothetical protein